MRVITTTAHKRYIVAETLDREYIELDDEEWPADMDAAHHKAALLLAEKLGWRTAAMIGGPTTPGVMAWVDVSEIASALAELVRLFLNGQHYETRNPYSRPQVKAGLVALQLMLRKGGGWMDAMNANDPPLAPPPTVVNPGE